MVFDGSEEERLYGAHRPARHQRLEHCAAGAEALGAVPCRWVGRSEGVESEVMQWSDELCGWTVLQ